MFIFQFLKQGLHMHTQFLHLHYIVHFLKNWNSSSQDLNPNLKVCYSFLPKSSHKFYKITMNKTSINYNWKQALLLTLQLGNVSTLCCSKVTSSNLFGQQLDLKGGNIQDVKPKQVQSRSTTDGDCFYSFNVLSI